MLKEALQLRPHADYMYCWHLDVEGRNDKCGASFPHVTFRSLAGLGHAAVPQGPHPSPTSIQTDLQYPQTSTNHQSPFPLFQFHGPGLRNFGRVPPPNSSLPCICLASLKQNTKTRKACILCWSKSIVSSHGGEWVAFTFRLVCCFIW